MKKAWKYTLAAVGIPLLCFGGLALDSYFRALSAIADHDARLAADMAAARSGHPPRPQNAHAFEEGHSGRNSARARLIDATILSPLRTSSPDLLLKQLETAQDHLREGGYAVIYNRSEFEHWELRRLQGLLMDPTLPADKLRDLARSFDRIRSTSPTVADIITGEHLLDRAEVLGVLHLKRDPYGMIRRPPGWREFYSWRILIAKTLLQLDDHYQQLLPLASLPGRKGEAAAIHQWWSRRSEKEDLRGRSKLRESAVRVFKVESLRAAEWQFTRVVVAISLFEAEKGRDLRDLAELVPDYLPTVPVSFTGHACSFEKGVLMDAGLEWCWPFTLK